MKLLMQTESSCVKNIQEKKNYYNVKNTKFKYSTLFLQSDIHKNMF